MVRGRAGVVVGADGVIEAGRGTGGKDRVARDQEKNQDRESGPALSSIMHQREHDLSGL